MSKNLLSDLLGWTLVLIAMGLVVFAQKVLGL